MGHTGREHLDWTDWHVTWEDDNKSSFFLSIEAKITNYFLQL